MDLAGLLTQERSNLLKRWRDAILETYPAGSRQFLRKEKDTFANPVGTILGQELDALFDAFTALSDDGKIKSCLENILRIRAVQDFSPSGAVAFILDLKKIVSGMVKAKGLGNGITLEVAAFNRKVDDLLLLAFDVYSGFRLKLYELRVHEVQNQVGALLKRANLVCEIPDADPAV